ncbi:gliding motility-associated C-terminal domain-containing protein [Lutibacter oricola]|uniref:Gliding motility-associated C-terminal domain-containing protein n=1 Tax=Lutibacter oricola TaxID=762486 RepID=A0A1H2RHI3_9FLAO|nr:T9SS type B sorting domain-containing protein [Lutibacter oricola]SDW18755.1 gliding motility-associated C-terminal domain-containing protein [Lutibacter oricola]
MKKFILLLGVLLLSNTISSQILEINNSASAESSYTPQQLVEDILISGACAQVDNFTSVVSGAPTDTNTKSYGYFKKPAGSSFPFEEGIILTCGRAFPAGNATSTTTVDFANGTAGDADLETALGQTNTNDATYIKFDFTPTSSTISFRYLMASEEYNGNFECTYADAFAFLLRPVGTTTYTNLAVVPSTTTPVSTTTIHPDVAGVCPAINEAYFEGYNLGDTNYGGRTKVFIASATVVPNQKYEIKLVIADQGDSSLDTAVFLEAGSFLLDADLGAPKLTSTNNAACGGSILLDASIVATSYKWFKDGVLIPGETSQTYNANLGDGLYKVEATLAVGCVADDEIDVEFTSQPTATTPTNIIQCDDNGDGLMYFDFTTKDTEIENGQTDVNTTYYTSQANADARTGALTSPYESGNATIYARVENNASTNCYATTSFTIEVIDEPSPLDAASILPIEMCDNTSFGTDIDGFITEDLTTKDTEILNGQSAANFNVDYYTDASYNIASLVTTPTAFTNTIAGGQTIYVRVSNKINSLCYKDTSFIFTVFSYPTVNPIVDLTQCDNDTDSFSLFNLTEANILISSGTGETFTYYLTEAEAITGLVADQITNFTNYQNPTPINSFVYARIENVNGCFRTARINLIVGVSQIPSTFNNLEYAVCDDELVDGDKRNGIASFDFSDAEQTIENLFPSQNVKVTFYNNEADALAELNAIPDISNHRNEGYPNTQNIYVRVDSEVVNSCEGFGHYITLTVEEIPVANPVTFARQCDDVPTDTELSSEFDTSNLEADVLLGQTNANVTYFAADGSPLTDINGNAITSPFPAAFRTLSQIITARVTNNTTNVASGNACYEETTIEFIVDITPVANPVIIAPACDDGISDVDGLHEFDTSNIESTLLGTQTGMTVTYTDESGAALPSPLPNPFNTSTQTITVQIENPTNTTCIATTTIDFIVNPLPDFEVTSPQIICLNNPVTTLSIDSELEAYSYNWQDENGNTIATNSAYVDVFTSGLYTVTATNTITNCTRDLEIQVNDSNIASITKNDITIVDDSENNTITIDPTNLGIGDYEFSLNDPDFGYQDDPFFDYVEAGIHTIYARDKNACGITPFEVAVLGFPKFFTPNNDGYNDSWKILGATDQFYASSLIYIFDRFGKLIAQFNTLNNSGWNGVYNGSLLTSSDYWFKVQLTDKEGNVRERSGHFSLIRN